MVATTTRTLFITYDSVPTTHTCLLFDVCYLLLGTGYLVLLNGRCIVPTACYALLTARSSLLIEYRAGGWAWKSGRITVAELLVIIKVFEKVSSRIAKAARGVHSGN